MKNNEALKKHHFWILFGLAPLLVLLAVIFLMTGVSSAISKQKTEIDDAVKKVQGAKPPGEGSLKELAKQKELLQARKGELWKENWDRQKGFFTWPRAPRGEFAKYADLKFGDRLREVAGNEFDVFVQNYPEAYQELARRVAPTKFAGGWQAVLRHVPNWGEQKPRSEQIWLALEDLWVQRAVLEPIKVVNDETATFAPVPDPQAGPLKKRFRSRVWDLALEVADGPPGTGKVLKGRLKNRTGQLQLLGVGNTMRLLVWLDRREGVPPVPFDVQGEFVAGDAEIEVPALPTHTLGAGVNPVEIARVVHQLDERTVPIRRIDRVALGYRSAKHATAELKNPTFWPDEAAPAGATPGGVPGAPGAESGAPGTPAPGPGGEGRGYGGAAGTAGGPAAVLDANRKRYLEVTEQVRRMPVGLVVVVDQMFIPDVLVAYANSPFRFHTVQTHWRRFQGSLGSAAGAGGAAGPSGGGGDEGGSEVGAAVGEGLAPGGGPPTSGGPGYPGMGFPGYGGPASSTVSEAQANAGLVELTIYGLVSLYEKYDEKKDGAAAAAGDAPKADAPKPDDPKGQPAPAAGEGPKADTPKADGPKGDAPAPGEPKSGGPKTGDPKAPDAGAPPAGTPPAAPNAPPPPAAPGGSTPPKGK